MASLLTWTTALAIYLAFSAFSHFGGSFRHLNIVLGVLAVITVVLLALGI